MEKVIITGADGFVGSYTTEYFLSQGKTVLAIDVADEPKRLKPHPGLRYLKCDIAHPEVLNELLAGETYDTFIHFAWRGSAGPERMDYELQTRNALTAVACLKVAKQLGCNRFLCAGSIMEYEAEAAIHAQGSRPGMAYIYGISKLLAHCLCKPVAVELGIDLLWPMITNAYGVGEISPRFVNTTLRKVIRKEPLQFTAATQNYDFVYVSDVARAFYLIAEKGKPYCEYMIGSGNAQPLKKFIHEMAESCGAVTEPIFGDIPFTGTNMPLEVFGIEALKQDCGFVPEITFGEGTKMTMDWLKEIEQ